MIKPRIMLYLALLFAAGLHAQVLVKYRDGLLAVDFNNLDLKLALEQITHQTGVKFSISDKLEDSILSDSFSDLSLEQGIRRLLKGYNYIMVFEEGKQPKQLAKVMLLAKYQGGAPGQSAALQRLSTPASSAEIVLPKQASGHYSTGGAINNQAVEFLVDTGATAVTLSGTLANELGLGYGAETTVHTANGDTTGFMTELNNVDLGGLPLQNIAAVILPTMNSGRRVLLGMSVLQGFELVQQQDKLIIRKRR